MQTQQMQNSAEEILTPAQSMDMIKKGIELAQSKGVFTLGDAFHLYCSFEILLEYLKQEQDRAFQNEKVRQLAEAKAHAIEHEYNQYKLSMEKKVSDLSLLLEEKKESPTPEKVVEEKPKNTSKKSKVISRK